VNRLDKVAEALSALEVLTRRELVKRWTARMESAPPKSSSRIFLLRALSYELQCQNAPNLSKSDQKVLRTILLDQGAWPASFTKTVSGEGKKFPRPKPRITLVPGSRLVREWNGRPYTVSVIEEGFVYKDRTWTSLSAIAKDITGAHWSGPRFFGLHKATA
jgi:hypothetical protein